MPAPAALSPGRRQQLIDATLLPLLLDALKQAPRSPRDRPELLADLLDLLQELPGFLPLARALLTLEPEPARVQSALQPLLTALPPRGRHHLGLLHLRWGAEALEAPDVSPTQRARDAARHWELAAQHLHVVLASPSFFEALTEAAGATDRAAELHRRAPDLLLAPHGEALLQLLAAESPSEPSRVEAHWSQLASPLPPLAEAAARWRARLVDHLIEGFTRQAAALDPLQATTDALRQPLWYAQRFTHVAGMHEPLTVAVIEQTVAWGWTLYKTRSEDKLRDLTAAVLPFEAHLESMLLRQTGAFGRNSLCADLLLFLADFADRDGQHRLFLRALEVCPGHRNTRLMLSYHHLHTANLLLNRFDAHDPTRALVPGVGRDLQAAADQAAAAIEEARACFPDNERLPDYERRLTAARAKLA